VEREISRLCPLIHAACGTRAREAAECGQPTRRPKECGPVILEPARFSTFSRLLHWLMAVMVVAMLFLGIGMAASVSIRYRVLVSIHRPLGIAILILVVIRFVNRLVNPPPRLPVRCSAPAGFGATAGD